jgi:putative nucleotidyltransferase with HDIG domain
LRAHEPDKAQGDEELAKLANISSGRSQDTVERTLSAAREVLGMEVAFVSEFVGGEQVYRRVAGDADSFGFEEDTGIPLEGTFCQRVIAGTLTNAVPDARSDERVKDLDVTRETGIGSYVGVPLSFSDGRLYGTMCCISHSPDPSLKERDVEFMKVLARLVSEQLEREELEAEKQRLAVESAGLRALLAAIEARDGYTGGHSKVVLELASAVARRMGLSEEDAAVVRQAALLHDIGKIAIPDEILRKPAPLGEQEWEVMRRHPEIGERIVASVPGLAHLASIIRAEHERWDGEGYPDGLRGEQIPLASRIVLACDAWHAMSSDRPYRDALDVQRKVRELEENMGAQFDPGVVFWLVEVLKERHLLPPEESERIIAEALRAGGERSSTDSSTDKGYVP